MHRVSNTNNMTFKHKTINWVRLISAIFKHNEPQVWEWRAHTGNAQKSFQKFLHKPSLQSSYVQLHSATNYNYNYNFRLEQVNVGCFGRWDVVCVSYFETPDVLKNFWKFWSNIGLVKVLGKCKLFELILKGKCGKVKEILRRRVFKLLTLAFLSVAYCALLCWW